MANHNDYKKSALRELPIILDSEFYIGNAKFWLMIELDTNIKLFDLWLQSPDICF